VATIRPSTDEQVLTLAAGKLDSFAAWSVESRSRDQVLLTDFRDRTRSWLMAANIASNGATGTRLYFGSAIVPVVDAPSSQAKLSFTYRALLDTIAAKHRPQ